MKSTNTVITADEHLSNACTHLHTAVSHTQSSHTHTDIRLSSKPCPHRKLCTSLDLHRNMVKLMHEPFYQHKISLYFTILLSQLKLNKDNYTHTHTHTLAQMILTLSHTHTRRFSHAHTHTLIHGDSMDRYGSLWAASAGDICLSL